MKRKLIELVLIFLCLILISGCKTVEETLYLRQAQVTTSIKQPPIHLSDSTEIPSLNISPKFSINSNTSFTGDITQSTQLSRLDTTFVSGENSLVWDMTKIDAGIDFDLILSKGFAIFFGAAYSSQTNFSSWGGNFGIGLFGYNNGNPVRLDLGIQVHTSEYDAYTIVHRKETGFFGGEEEFIGFFRDVGSSTHLDPYLSLTYNSAFKDWLINFFINLGYNLQTLFSFEPRSHYFALGPYSVIDNRGSSTAGFFNFTPGIYFNLSDSQRIVIGSRFFFENLVNDGDPKLFIIPMMQVDFKL